MAHLIPDALPDLKHNGGLFRELDVLERLQRSLPDSFAIYHSVPLHSVQSGIERFGEIDIVVLDPIGNLLLIEVKAGQVIVRNGNILKLYSDREHDVGRQYQTQYSAMRHRLNEAGLVTSVFSCLIIPDYSLHNAHVVAIPRERIIDSEQFDNAGTLVRSFLAAGKGCNNLAALKQFLNNEFNVLTDCAVIRDQVRGAVRQISDGLATWVPRITSPSGVIQIHATAGSGKTQLALKLMETAIGQSRTVAYICFNRTLADHLRKIAPARADIANFHEMCVEHFRKTYAEPDFSEPGIFEKVTAAYLKDSEGFKRRYDVLIIDEGQDLDPAWLEGVCNLLKLDGKLYVMDDPDQKLYDRPAFALNDAVEITCQDNFRTPRYICDVINALGLSSHPVQARNPYKGALPGFHPSKTEASMLNETASAVQQLLEQGFALSDIAVLTSRGLKKSALLSTDQIGPYRTRRFTGSYTPEGDQIWTDGDLLVDSVYRYKGQSAPAVVLSEVDFAEFGQSERRKLFVGMTRAQMAVEIVLSERAEKLLAQVLDGS